MSDPTRKEPDPFRQTFEVAVGPNVDGDANMARLAHTLPNPEIVDDAEHPNVDPVIPVPKFTPEG